MARRLAEWEVLLPDHHPGYITWDEYERNRMLIAGNMTPGALLAGLLRCGTCGRKLAVRYAGRRGQVVRYACATSGP